MNQFVARFVSGLLLSSALMVCSAQIQAQQTDTAPATNAWSEKWIARPWEMRYVIMGMGGGSWDSKQRTAKKINAEPPKGRFDTASYEEFFDSTSTVRRPGSERMDDQIEVVVIEFDAQGLVTTPNRARMPLRGRIAFLTDVLPAVLSSGDGPKNLQYGLGYWHMGSGDASTEWAPTLCSGNEIPSPFSANNVFYKYGPKFAITSQSATFGCREWAHQLYDDTRPYIDVTSYVPKNKMRPYGNYIQEFIGWARFGDKKPVIGKHEATWMCLYDCPNGDKPGVIPDIDAWAAQNGWTPPKPPRKMPMFSDPPRKRAAVD